MINYSCVQTIFIIVLFTSANILLRLECADFVKGFKA